jgi:peroxiredoxin
VLMLPMLELAIGVALIPARLAWYGACGALGLLAIFLIAVGVAMIRGRKPDCHCFGQLHSAPVGRSTLIRNALLAAGAGWLVSRGQLQPGLDVWAWYFSLSDTGQKLAIVAAGALVLLFFRLVARARPVSQTIASQMPSLPSLFDYDEEEEAPEAPGEQSSPIPRKRPASEPAHAAPVRPAAMGVGLPIGTPAPEFELPALAGETRSLQSLRADGKDVVLIFSSPFCKPCEALGANLVRWKREMPGLPNIVLISRGTPQDNLAKLKGFESSRVLLQGDFDVAEAYDCNSTPTAVLVGSDGLIRSELATGGPAIKQLLASSSASAKRPVGSAFGPH